MPPLTVKQVLAMALFWTIISVAAFSLDSEARVALLTRFQKSESFATITKEADPHNHNYISYEYTLSGKTFSRVGYGPDHKEMRVGDQVRLRYFPAYPELATIGSDADQSDALKDGVVRSVFVATITVLFVCLKEFRTSRKIHKRAAQ